MNLERIIIFSPNVYQFDIMRNIKITCFIVAVSSLCSCNSQDYRNKFDQSKIEVSFDSIQFEINKTSLNYYDTYTVNDISNELICLNRQTNLLDVFDINNKKISKQLILPIGRGPGEISEDIAGIYFHNNDSMFIFHSNYISILDSNLNEMIRYDLYKNIEKAHDYSYIINSAFQLRYIPNSNSIYIHNLYPAELVGRHINSSILSKLDLNSGTIEELPIHYSRSFKKDNGRVGFLRWLNLFSVNNDSLILSSQFDDEIIILDTKSNKHRVVQLSNQNSDISKLSKTATHETWVEHAISNAHRFAFMYDKWRNVYYRFVWEGIPYKINKETFNSMLDKPLVLEVYSDSFDLIGKVKLKDYRYRFDTWFIFENGLYISPTHPSMGNTIDDFDVLKFDIIKIRVL
jgi:hypothetical protein